VAVRTGLTVFLFGFQQLVCSFDKAPVLFPRINVCLLFPIIDCSNISNILLTSCRNIDLILLYNTYLNVITSSKALTDNSFRLITLTDNSLKLITLTDHSLELITLTDNNYRTGNIY
jgi:hypothetical protein